MISCKLETINVTRRDLELNCRCVHDIKEDITCIVISYFDILQQRCCSFCALRLGTLKFAAESQTLKLRFRGVSINESGM